MSAPATQPFPRLNQRIEVALGDRGTAQYFSRLVEETAETLRISLPEMEGKVLELREGDALRLWYTQTGGYWCLNTQVRTLYRHDGETIVEVERLGDVHRAQRRNHVRVDVALMTHITVEARAENTPEDTPERMAGTRMSAITRNISGGGVSFRSSRELYPGDRLSLSFYLPEHGGEISSKARIVHVVPDPGKEGAWNISCTFDRMSITDRERIIRFLFFRQRELAAKKRVM